MVAKVYGVSDNLCIIDGAPYPDDEVDCLNPIALSNCWTTLWFELVAATTRLKNGQFPYGCPQNECTSCGIPKK